MGLIFFCLAALLFFFDGVGVNFIPHPVTWGLFCVALGCAVGNNWRPWAKSA